MFPYIRPPVEVAIKPVVDTAIYASGDNIGGLQFLPNVAFRPGAWASLIRTIVTDKSHQDAILNVLLLNTLPTSTVTDQAAFTLAAADLPFVVANIHIAVGDYVSFTTPGVADDRPVNGPVPLLTRQNSGLWAIIVSGGTPTYASASDLQLRLDFIQLG